MKVTTDARFPCIFSEKSSLRFETLCIVDARRIFLKRGKRLGLNVALPLFVLFCWTVASVCGAVNSLLLPSPMAVVHAAIDMLRDGTLIAHVAASFSRVIVGYTISASLALFLSWMCARHAALEETLHYPLEFIRIVPPLSLIPLLILWLGIGEAPKLAIVMLASFFSVYLTSFSAFRHVDPKFLELAKSLNLTASETFKHILLPQTLPSVMTCMRLGFGFAWRALIGAELIAAASGLGWLIEDASELGRTDVMLVGIFSIAILGILADKVFVFFTSRISPWAGTLESITMTRLK